MAVYRADLTGTHRWLIAHLLPGDQIFLTWSCGEKTINANPAAPWVALFDDDPLPRICRFGTGARLAQNTRVRQRPPISAAVKALRAGGVAFVVCEMRQETDKYNEPFGPLVSLPAGHVLIPAEGGV